MPNDLSFEREKWLADIEFRKREWDIKERDQQNRDAELRLKEREHQSATWRSPLIIAILAATVAAAGNAVVAIVNGSLQRDLESSKAESVRILEMIRTGDTEHAASNLAFLLKSGLITDQNLVGKLQGFLNTRLPGSGPSLPRPAGEVGFEKSAALTEPVQTTLQTILSRYFEYLDRIGFPKRTIMATVSVEPMSTPNAHYDGAKNRIVIDPRMAQDPTVALREYNHHLLSTESNRRLNGTVAFEAIESGLADYFACSFLNNPRVGEQSAHLFGPEKIFIRTLDNKKTYDLVTTKAEPWERRYVGGEVWGGLFWDIRRKLGAATTDALFASVWRSFTPLDADDKVAPRFIETLLSKAAAKGQDTHGAVRSAVDARKIPRS